MVGLTGHASWRNTRHGAFEESLLLWRNFLFNLLWRVTSALQNFNGHCFVGRKRCTVLIVWNFDGFCLRVIYTAILTRCGLGSVLFRRQDISRLITFSDRWFWSLYYHLRALCQWRLQNPMITYPGISKQTFSNYRWEGFKTGQTLKICDYHCVMLLYLLHGLCSRHFERS